MKIFFKHCILVGLIITAPVHAVNQCKGRLGTNPNGSKFCRGYIYDDHKLCADNKPSSSCYGFRADSGNQNPLPRKPKLIRNENQKVYSPNVKTIMR
jgi:hypothetical protein